MKLGLIFMCWFYSVMSCAGDIITISADKNNKEFVVTLPANPTTGFQWTLVNYDKKTLRAVSNHYSPKKTKLMGSGGEMAYTFSLNKGKVYPETTKMTFRYARSWEKTGASVTTVLVSFSKK